MLDQTALAQSVWLDETSCDIDAFRAHVAQTTSAADYPAAAEIVSNIPLYDGAALRRALADDATARPVMAEWNRAFLTGPGIVAIKGGYTDLAMLDAVTEEMNAIIAEEEASGGGKGDHFAKAGANSRIWNSHEKLGMRRPDLFVRYNANEIIRRVCEAWLGPAYQITCQANVVRPGGKAQTAHRDYHMGFQSVDDLKGYPASQHALSATLTLQGAVAHSDMPIASGPTKLLPYSQSYVPGYIAVLLPAFRAYFEENHVQVPLEKGDMLFFNPATFHAAGENTTADVQRFANLMQIGSAYGRTLEIVDRARLSTHVYPHLLAAVEAGTISDRDADTVIAATSEGYPFPASLELEPPLGGMAPPAQAAILRKALAERWPADRLAQAIAEHAALKRSH